MSDTIPGVLLDRVVEQGECWLWTRTLYRDGYGKAGNSGAHRWAYQQIVGPIPDGLELDHLCRTPRCVRPDHLEPVTRAENMRRRYADMTHCKHGHEFSPENVYRSKRGVRECRQCVRDRARAYRQRRAS